MYFVHLYYAMTSHSRYFGPFSTKKEANKIKKRFENLKENGSAITDMNVYKFDDPDKIAKEIKIEYGVDPDEV